MKPPTQPIPQNNIRCLVLDLDDTLYPQDSGAWNLVRQRIDMFLRAVMQFPAEDVDSIRKRLFQQYGTTLRGLQVEYEVDMDDFLRYVHDVHLEAVLEPNPELDQMLAKLPQRKIIFTNAYAPHAHRVLNILGVTGHFDQIIDIYEMYPYCKPQVEAFQKALAAINEVAENCLLVDDNLDNLDTGKSLGMTTVSIGIHRHDGSPHIADIVDLAPLLL